MVASPFMMANAAALACILVVAIGERWHMRRIGRVSKLAFGDGGRPATWVRLVPLLRVLTMAMIAWGCTVLLLASPIASEVEPAKEASKHVLVCLDSSPSMFLKDAGPRQSGSDDQQQRIVRAGEVMQAVLDRLDPENTRITVFGVYTKAVPIIEETFDKSVVKNLFDGLPVFSAFKAGPTALTSSVSDAIEYARRWPIGSTLLVVISDGDSNEKTSIRAVPKAIANTLVIGLGKTSQSTLIAGHSSRQDADSLRSLATELRGTYFDANTRHIPTELLDRLAIVQPRMGGNVGLRDAAVAAIVLGALVLALLLPTLSCWGIPKQAFAAADSSRFSGEAH